MKVSNVRAMSLGLEERSGRKKDGTEYAFCRFNFVVEGESESRRIYVEDYGLKRAMREVSEWGSNFTFDGDVDGTGKVTIIAINKEE